MLRPHRHEIKRSQLFIETQSIWQPPFVIDRPALKGRADMAELGQILQWRSAMGLNILNFVPMGRNMLRPYKTLSRHVDESSFDDSI